MTLAELISEVYTITGRSDRVGETASAIKSATLKAHQSDYYYKDLYETGIAFATSDYLQQLDYRATLPRFRAVKYIRKYDNVNAVAGKILDLIVPENVMDRYATEKEDIYYVAGAYINIKSSDAQQYYLAGFYLNPDVTTSGYTSWIAIDHPYAIVFDAAATVFKAIGKDEEAAAYRTLVPEQIQLIKQSNIIAAGY
jgi:hypothetical protein